MLEFHPLEEQATPPARMAALLEEFQGLLAEDGMASMDEYGDMLKWALPGRDGRCRYFHVYHPGFCSWSDAFYGTVHDHGGRIGGTVLLGAMEHHRYEATPDPDGDRFHKGTAYRLARHTNLQRAGTSYALPPHVAHWLRPLEPTLTYFEEEDNGVMGELVHPASHEPDEHLWEQADAERFLPELRALVDRQAAGLRSAGRVPAR